VFRQVQILFEDDQELDLLREVEVFVAAWLMLLAIDVDLHPDDALEDVGVFVFISLHQAGEER